MKFKPKYTQLMFVAIAFFMMVWVSYIYIRHIVEEQLQYAGNELMNSSTATIKSMLFETEISLENVVFIIERSIREQAGYEELDLLVRDLTAKYNTLGGKYFAFNGIYGIVDGIYIDGSDWNPPADYIPKSRPWYIGAVSTGEIHYTDPYIDADTGKIIISVSKILSEDGVMRGVAAIDFDITAITEYVNNLQITGGGYGFLLNDKKEVVSHTDIVLAGRLFSFITEDSAKIDKILETGEEVSAERVTNPDSGDSILFLSPLFNGWHIGIITPVEAYYSKLRAMAITLAALGLTLGVSLCLILLRLSTAKEVADERNKSKTSFLARMSHEIRTPLNAITGMAELLVRVENLPPKAYNQAVSIKRAGANLLSLINDILDLSKIESGKLEITNGEYLLSSLVNDVLNIIRLRLLDKPVYFTANVDSNLPNKLIGDELRIRQVLINLLSNAVKYTHEGFVSFYVYGEVNRVSNSVMLVFEISDSGVGIREEDMKKLFDDFAQFDLRANRGIEGSGLGLAITKNLAMAMGGDIQVKSIYKRGSIFTFKLPQNIDFQTESENQVYEKIATVEDADAKNVLLFEPRAYYSLSLMETFKNLKVKATLVTTREDFTEFIHKNSYTNIFLPTVFYGTFKEIIDVYQPRAATALISESSDICGEEDVRTVIMPAYSISISNILNNIPDTLGYTDDDRAVRYCFPESRLLVVDDIITNLTVMEGLLAPFEGTVDLAESGSKAVELVKTNKYDIIFMDHMMPGMDGIETTTIIRNLKVPYAKTVPIIALTANAVAGMRDMFIQHGMDDFLPKPIEPQKLNAALLKWIPREKRRSADEICKDPNAETAQVVIDTKDECGRELYDNLVELAAAINIMDMKAVDAVLATIQSKRYSNGLQEKIELIAGNILIFEYDAAKAIIDNLTEK